MYMQAVDTKRAQYYPDFCYHISVSSVFSSYAFYSLIRFKIIQNL